MTEHSSQQLNLQFHEDGQQLRLVNLSYAGHPWLHPAQPSELFACHVDGKRLSNIDLRFIRTQTSNEHGIQKSILLFEGEDVQIEYHLFQYTDASLVECWTVITNRTQFAIHVERIDSLSVNLPSDSIELFSFTGDWGSEFEPHSTQLDESTVLQSRSGRSSKGNHPWFALTAADGQILSASVAWSANWIFRFEPLPGGGFRLTGGINDWEFGKTLEPGESVQGAPVILALGPDLNFISQQYARVGRKYWYPKNELASMLPVEWNHWWPYEDAEINETIFMQNVERAAEIGIEVCTLDAGWFGPSDPGTFWEHYRGDWHLVNDQRFPSGIRKLSDHVHAHGMKFGIWCEFEGLSQHAALAREHPEYVAIRDGSSISSVCFGNPDVQHWAYETLKRLIVEYNADWIKVDYNLDAQAGCNRTDHGHGVGDGLYAHVHGYYRVMERIRTEFPHVVLENCSSGGLRIDLGTLRQTHMTYLSDPDYPEHDLQIFWGASLMLATDVLLHWTFSHWRNINPPPYQTFNPHDPSLTREKWDYMARISMLGIFGLSQRLPELPEWLYQRMVENIRIYKEHVRRFVKEADLYRLTTQPRRNGEGDRWAAFQYSLPEKSEHLLFVFRMPGGEAERHIQLQSLDADRIYKVRGLEGELKFECRGKELMEDGLVFNTLSEQGSALLKLS
jgi:alpha-galactosidase